ncbi:hypothetical protein DFH29DRAFT_983569 [Suillus ampliporus]|nr:hypothetical protein DFH29DRAFT_983569 [Suillus ampliporus]
MSLHGDADKYAALKVIHVIRTLQAELSVIKDQLNLDDADFVKFYAKEKLYLEQLKEPPIQDRLCIRYVEVLDDLELCREEWNTARSAANNALTTVRVGNFAEISATLTTARICSPTWRFNFGIEEHWAIRCPEYVQFKEEASLGKYRAALNELEHLVVMRLFELSKLPCQAQQIGKALQCCSEAIRNAINRYNTQAAVLNLPHPKIILERHCRV